MNDPHDYLPEADDDPLLAEIISHLKRLEPPLETRVANRVAVAAELSRLLDANRKQRLPWWRRSIAIPVPLAASLLVLAALVLPSILRDRQKQPAMHADAPDHPENGAADSRIENPGKAKRTQAGQVVMRYYETETYLCGVGRVNSEIRYFIEE